MVYSDQIVAVKFHIFAFFYDRRMKVRQISRQSHAYKLRYIILADKSETRSLLLGCYHIKMATREIPFFFFFFCCFGDPGLVSTSLWKSICKK